MLQEWQNRHPVVFLGVLSAVWIVWGNGLPYIFAGIFFLMGTTVSLLGESSLIGELLSLGVVFVGIMLVVCVALATFVLLLIVVGVWGRACSDCWQWVRSLLGWPSWTSDLQTSFGPRRTVHHDLSHDVDKVKMRYRVIRTLVVYGPCTTAEIENVFRFSDGKEIDLLPILKGMDAQTIERDQFTGKWLIPGQVV